MLMTQKQGILSMDFDKDMQESVQELLQNAIDGFLEVPIATGESGQPDYGMVASVANEDF